MVNSHTAPQFLEVHIKASKKDPFRRGVLVYVYRWDPMGYMVWRGPGEGPFFTFEGGRYLTRQHFVTVLHTTT